MAIESSKVNCRQPFMAVMADGFVLDRKDKVSVLIREQGKRSSSRRRLVDGI